MNVQTRSESYVPFLRTLHSFAAIPLLGYLVATAP